MSWKEFFAVEGQKPYSKKLHDMLDVEYGQHVCYPKRSDMFKAFQLTELHEVKMVIIGQDPYHEPNQAMGLSFSVPSGVALPPSLQNIYKEIENDLGVTMRKDGDLTYLAKQGVLLLNAILSVRHGEALSHNFPEYRQFLEAVLTYLDQVDQPMVFLLWGNFARKLKPFIQNKLHFILESTHPSPLSANRGGFFGQHHFSRANTFLIQQGLAPISWKN